MPRRPFNFGDLHPECEDNFRLLADRLDQAWRSKAIGTEFKPFEGYRTPEHQDECYRAGTSKAKGWQSAHQYGLAVDFVARVNDQWSWDEDHDWKGLHDVAMQCGLIAPIRWDRPHIESPTWGLIRRKLVR